MEKLPDSGIYLLLIKKAGSEKLKVGALGELYFKEGYYIYVGAAQRNLRKRIERHIRKGKKKRWHIDYLLEDACVEDVFVLELPKLYEEKLALHFLNIYPSISGFGSSDTKAQAHLFYIGGRSEWENVKNIAKEVK